MGTVEVLLETLVVVLEALDVLLEVLTRDVVDVLAEVLC